MIACLASQEQAEDSYRAQRNQFSLELRCALMEVGRCVRIKMFRTPCGQFRHSVGILMNQLSVRRGVIPPQQQRRPFAGCCRLNWYPIMLCRAAVGGWPSTRCPGATANSFDTAGALLNLALWRCRWPRCQLLRSRAQHWMGYAGCSKDKIAMGAGPFPTEGLASRPRKASSTDVTSQAMLALNAWKKILRRSAASHPLIQTIERSLLKGLTYLNSQQQSRWQLVAPLEWKRTVIRKEPIL